MSAPRIRLRIDFGPDHAVGPGKIALLEHMRESGSLSQAARELDMSYRRAWQLLESLNAAFREPVVTTTIGGRGGGGTVVTELGEALIETYRRFEREVASRASDYFEPLQRRIAPAAARTKSTRRSLVASTSRGRGASSRRKAS